MNVKKKICIEKNVCKLALDCPKLGQERSGPIPVYTERHLTGKKAPEDLGPASCRWYGRAFVGNWG